MRAPASAAAASAALHDGALADAATVDKVIDARRRRGRRHAAASRCRLPSAAGGGGRRGGLRRARPSSPRRSPAATACWPRRPALILGQLGLDDAGRRCRDASTDAELIDLVTAELGSDWPRLVAPVFDGRKAVLFDDRWASAREDLAKLWLMDEDEIDADWPRLSERFEGAGHVVGTQATWWQGKALAAGRNIHASLFGRAAAGAENPGKGRYSRRDRGRDGCIEGLDRRVGGRRSCSTAARRSSRPRPSSTTTGWRSTATLYRDNARFGATLWVVPANMASYTDIDALVAWVGNEQTRKPWAAVDSPQGRADADAAVPVRGAAGGRRPVRGRLALRDGDEGSAVGRAAADRRAVAHRLRARHRRRGCTWCCPVRRTAACSAATAPTARPSPRSTRW